MSAPLIAVLNGPNLNLLGTREPEIYGRMRLDDIEVNLQAFAREHGAVLDMHQSNSEGTLVDWIQDYGARADGIILNAAAYTHTSVALRDAVAACSAPVIEVHLSNIFAREDFRHHSHISAVAKGMITGLGPDGYMFALQTLLNKR